MQTIALALLIVAIVLSGGVFGFFYSWSFTIMPGLSTAEPSAAIAAMNAINASISNALFAAFFFGTPVAAAALAARIAGRRGAAAPLLIATLVYGIGCLAVTALVHIPMNEALAQAQGGHDGVWRGYAPVWTRWNHLRTGACLATFVLTLAALWCWRGIGDAGYGRGRQSR